MVNLNFDIRRSLCIALALFGSATTALQTAPLTPSQDSFYSPPYSAWYAEAPGALLKIRNVTISSYTAGTALAVQAAYQLQFRTTNYAGEPAIGITTLLVPASANFSRVASYHAAYDSPDNDCAPSYGLQLNASTHAAEAVGELPLIQEMLNKGICVSVPDYEGVNAAFLVGPQTAFTVLDSIRAVVGSGAHTQVSADSIITLFGYSGGAFAGEWASEYASSYAPELNIRGVAIGGLPTNITTSLYSLEGGSDAGLIAAGTNGIARAVPEFAHYLNAHVIPANLTLFQTPLSQCQADSKQPTYGYLAKLAGTTIADFFSNADALVTAQLPLLNAIGVMGRHGVPQFPMVVWKGTADEVVPPIADTTALVDKFCTFGTIVQYYRVINGTHIGSVGAGLGYAFAFMDSIYAGTYNVTRCSTTDVSTAGTPV